MPLAGEAWLSSLRGEGAPVPPELVLEYGGEAGPPKELRVALADIARGARFFSAFKWI